MSTYNNNLIKKLDLASKATTPTPGTPAEEAMMENMSDPRYLRQSSALINDALQKGFDVLQLADGDIVMTGVKTVVYQYTWDNQQGKLVRTKAASQKNVTALAKPSVDVDAEDEEEEGISVQEDA